MARKTIVRHQPDDLATLADHDLGIKRKPACEFKAQLRAADWLPNHKGTRGADVDGIEMLQLFGEDGRSEGSVTADVDTPQKNHECHELPLMAPLRSVERAATCSNGRTASALIPIQASACSY